MQIYFIFSRCFGWFHPNELTRISCELLRQLGNDEATEGGIVLLFLDCGVVFGAMPKNCAFARERLLLANLTYWLYCSCQKSIGFSTFSSRLRV